MPIPLKVVVSRWCVQAFPFEVCVWPCVGRKRQVEAGAAPMGQGGTAVRKQARGRRKKVSTGWPAQHTARWVWRVRAGMQRHPVDRGGSAPQSVRKGR